MGVKRKKDVELYGLDPDFERDMVVSLCRKPKLYNRIGNYIEPSALKDDVALRLMQTAQVIANETGSGPSSDVIVIQRLNRMREEGSVSQEEINACLDFFDEFDDNEEQPNLEQIANEIIPILKRRKQREALEVAIDSFGKRKDISQSVETLQRVDRLGATEETKGLDISSAGAFDLISQLQSVVRLGFDVPEIETLMEGGLWRSGLGVVVAGPGGGKCHAKGQGILMADGSIKKVEDICRGDLLAAPESGFRTVLQTNTGHDEMVEIVPKRGDPWRVNLDHILTVAVNGKEPLVDVSVKEFLTWSAKKQKRSLLVRCAATFQGRVELPIDPYLFGVVLGDGSTTSGSLNITTADQEILDYLKDIVTVYGLRVSLRSNNYNGAAKTYGVVGIQGVKNPILEALDRFELRRKNCHEKFIPHVYKVASVADRLCLLAGLLDTDGSYRGFKRSYEYSTASEKLFNDVLFLARSVGLAAYGKAVQKVCGNTGAVGTYYRVYIGGDVWKIPCRIKRKQAVKYTKRVNYKNTRFEIKPCGKEDYFGFTLDGDGRYLLDDFTVTHNSIFLSHIAACAIRNPDLLTVFITLELPKPLILARLFANLFDIPTNNILTDSLDKAKAKAATMKMGTCVIEEFTPKVTTLEDVRDFVEKIEADLKRPVDLLVVDYADKLGARKTDDSSYREMSKVYEGLRHFAVEKNMWVWTASQPQRAKEKGRKKLTIDSLADSQEKVRVADMVLAINKKEDGTQLEFCMLKNRIGIADTTAGPLPHEFDMGRIAPIIVPVAAADDETV